MVERWKKWGNADHNDKLSVLRHMRAGDIMSSMVIRVNNTVLYT